VKLKVSVADEALLRSLECKGLISRFCTAPGKDYAVTEENVAECLRQSTDVSGGCLLLRVRVRATWPSLFHFHSQEEHILLVCDKPQKPLFFVFAYDAPEVLQEKIRERRLTPADLVVVQAKFNNPRTSFFTIEPGVVHGEFTVSGTSSDPVFFVVEPSRAGIQRLDLSPYFDWFKSER